MKFIYDPDVEKLNSMLTFDTPECRIIGGLDIYTTKPAGNDKKLFRTLEKQINDTYLDHSAYQSGHHQEQELMTSTGFAHSLSPPSIVPIMSPPLDEHMMLTSQSVGARRGSMVGAGGYSFSGLSTSANAINGNAYLSTSLGSNPGSSSYSAFGPLDKPASRKVYVYVISILNASHADHDFSALTPADFIKEPSVRAVESTFKNTLFGMGIQTPPELWKCLDQQIDLNECSVYSHTPSPSFLADEPGTMWSVMWFFFNKRKKRVAYLHLSAIRYQQRSPLMTAHDYSSSRHRRKSDFGSIPDDDEYMDEDYDLTIPTGSGNAIYDSDDMDSDGVVGALELE